MTVTYPPKAATAPQLRYLLSLMAERDALAFVNTLTSMIEDETLTSRRASEAIDFLKRQPRVVSVAAVAATSVPTEALTPGVYEVAPGEIYVVKPNQAKTRLYAKRLVEINADRLTETDEIVQIEFEYAPGAIFNIRPEHRMDAERGKALTIRYGKCICCGRKLKAAQSVERGIGPICIKYFG